MDITVRIATFNSENLFSRVLLLNKEGAEREELEKATIKELQEQGMVRVGRVRKKGTGSEWFRFTRQPINEIGQHNTARVIDAVNADVICLQEVEDLETLRLFNEHVLKPVQDKNADRDKPNLKYYSSLLLLNGNDQDRYINVAVMSRLEILGIRTHMFDVDDEGLIFRRDCLEVDVMTQSKKKITILISHLKSQIPSYRMVGSERVNVTPEIRKREIAKIVDILKLKLTNDPNGYIVLAGDLNGDPSYEEMKRLSEHDVGMINVVTEKLPTNQRWTLVYGTKKYQYDYLLISQNLKRKLKSVDIERRGISRSRTAFSGVRFDTVSRDGTEASDHCSVSMDIDV